MKTEIIRLGDAATFINGYPFKPTDWASSGKEIIRIQNLTKSNSTGANYFKGSISPRYRVQSGDLLISWSGTLGVFEWLGEDAWLNQHIFKVVFDKREIHKGFFKHLIQSKIREFELQVHGATMKHITKSKFDDTLIPLPPLSEQIHIAHVLDQADRLRQQDRQLLAYYDQLVQAVFVEMFGDPVRNEKGWKKIALGELSQIRRGASPRPIDAFIGNDVPWIKIGDGTKGSNLYIESTKVRVTAAGAKKSVYLEKGSLIFANCGVSLGFARILKIAGCIHDGWLSIEHLDDSVLNKIYLLKLLNTATDYFRSTAPDGTQPNLNTTIMKNFGIILPPIELQQRFEVAVYRIEESVVLLKEQQAQSEALFQSLLQQAFRGELATSQPATTPPVGQLAFAL